jgi:hypothetical protein
VEDEEFVISLTGQFVATEILQSHYGVVFVISEDRTFWFVQEVNKNLHIKYNTIDATKGIHTLD